MKSKYFIHEFSRRQAEEQSKNIRISKAKQYAQRVTKAYKSSKGKFKPDLILTVNSKKKQASKTRSKNSSKARHLSKRSIDNDLTKSKINSSIYTQSTLNSRKSLSKAK